MHTVPHRRSESARSLPLADIVQHLEGERRKQLARTLLLLLAAAIALTVMRGVLAGIESIRPFGPMFAGSMAFMLYLLKRGVSTDAIATATLVLMNLVFALMAYTSGGVSSHFMLMGLFLPLLGIHLHSLTAGKICAVVGIVIVVVFVALHMTDHNFPPLPVSDSTVYLFYGVATLIFIVAGTSILGYYFKLTNELALAAWEHANTDHLTGLANRRVVEATLEREAKVARRNSTPLTVLMIDVDHFKQFNDAYGHPAGDRCLQQVSDALLGVARRPTDLVARYGGEEFIVVLPDTSADAGWRLGEAVCSCIRGLHVEVGSEAGARITASVGVATLVAGEVDAAVLLKRADAELYRAKNSGRDQVCGATFLSSVA